MEFRAELRHLQSAKAFYKNGGTGSVFPTYQASSYSCGAMPKSFAQHIHTPSGSAGVSLTRISFSFDPANHGE